jgi:hypothetical protein
MAARIGFEKVQMVKDGGPTSAAVPCRRCNLRTSEEALGIWQREKHGWIKGVHGAQRKVGAFVKTLAVPEIYKAIVEAEPNQRSSAVPLPGQPRRHGRHRLHAKPGVRGGRKPLPRWR